jgi:hypothetical protein
MAREYDISEVHVFLYLMIKNGKKQLSFSKALREGVRELGVQ